MAENQNGVQTMKKVAAIAVAIAVIAWCVYSANMDQAVEVEASTVETGQLILYVEGEGEIAAEKSFVAVMPITGEIERINVDEGQAVVKNSLLFTVDASSQISDSVQQEAAQASSSETANSAYAMAIEQAQGDGISYEAFMELIEEAKEQFYASASSDELTFSDTTESQVSITSEIAGTVLSINVTEGTYAEAGSSAVYIGSEERVVQVWVYEKDFARVEEGQQVKVELTGATVQGTVESKSQTLKSLSEVTDPVGEVVIAFDGINIADVGSSAQVSIEYERIDDAVLIPVESLYKEDGIQYVFVIENGIAQKKRIKTGINRRREHASFRRRPRRGNGHCQPAGNITGWRAGGGV